MIVSRLIGGLGNQMFQYAVGRALSISRNAPFYLDIRNFSGYMNHNGFELQRIFDVPIKIATDNDVKNIIGYQSSRIIQKILKNPNLSFFRRNELVIEPHFQYWSNINYVQDNCYLIGYWQSEKYFSSFSDIIRKDFSFNAPLVGKNTEISHKIVGSNSISVHIRRGDYVTDKNTSKIISPCSIEYYSSAISYLMKNIESPTFFVFSDDISWAKKNIKIDATCFYIDNNIGHNSYLDMQLMSLCHHNIIANSTFSWWGAWLNPRKNKIVVAPKQWFSVGMKYDASDIIPATWTRM